MITFKIFFILTYLFAGNAKQISAKKVLEDMTLTYSQVEYMKSDFKKNSKSTLLGTNEKTKGKLEYSKSKFRLEVSGKSGSTFIKGNKSFWHISGKDIIIGDANKSVPTVFESIFSDPSIWAKLGITYISVPNKTAEIKVDTRGKMPNISEMMLLINLKKRTLLKISYLDDVNNSVDIEFKNTRFFLKAREHRFSYVVKKGDVVSRM